MNNQVEICYNSFTKNTYEFKLIGLAARGRTMMPVKSKVTEETEELSEV